MFERRVRVYTLLCHVCRMNEKKRESIKTIYNHIKRQIIFNLLDFALAFAVGFPSLGSHFSASVSKIAKWKNAENLMHKI